MAARPKWNPDQNKQYMIYRQHFQPLRWHRNMMSRAQQAVGREMTTKMRHGGVTKTALFRFQTDESQQVRCLQQVEKNNLRNAVLFHLFYTMVAICSRPAHEKENARSNA